jgi:hypothetical protein
MTARRLMSLDELARQAACRVRVVERMFQLGVFEATERGGGEPLFDAAAADRLRRALRLRADLRVGATGLGLVLDLLEEVERLRRLLEHRGG